MNNQQIDYTDYYRLPCGMQLEDFIAWKRLDFFEGSALKYAWRAGRKDGEPEAKDMAKCEHYCAFMARDLGVATALVAGHIMVLREEARTWDGEDR